MDNSKDMLFGLVSYTEIVGYEKEGKLYKGEITGVDLSNGVYQLCDPVTHVVISNEEYEQMKNAFVLQEVRAGRCEHVELDSESEADDE